MANTITRVTNKGSIVDVYASAARTASPDTVELEVAGHIGMHLTIDATAATATPSVVFSILGVDRTSGKTYVILASAAVTGTGTTVLRVGPALTAAANLVANDILPPIIRISAVHGDADSLTYSVGAAFCA
ncbi:hypothetical protein Rhe02_54840 [Rhizocola hellebori]|uniref:Uncharacterized protein n=1 Tax=Rhizocola hellebori TaxID=1392758 RepID=A0A8J3QD33_9ACTN|nr:hypothetical protein [Rhizocola hellebori]GIH07417.1 hypothetical protein Rhe02_54840 [Rhizocola hellebori]